MAIVFHQAERGAYQSTQELQWSCGGSDRVAWGAAPQFGRGHPHVGARMRNVDRAAAIDSVDDALK